MSKREKGAIAVDLGATSGRFAAGWIEDGQIRFEVVEQTPHHPFDADGISYWDLDALLQIVRRAIAYATTHFETATVGIDSWGVDHGFIDHNGKVIQSPVCYRDPSHVEAFEELRPHRRRLYELTGIQHQPFNTICQLVARRKQDPSLPERAKRWLILPDLLGFLLTGEAFYELTQASTTQLMGLDNRWSAEAFKIAGWPVPETQPMRPGGLGPELAPGIRLAHVGSHDTASAVCGFGPLSDSEMFLNVGTWSLAGSVIDHPIATPEAEASNFTNERTVDGRVRFLRNIPGFWVINRLHDELGIGVTIPYWLAGADLSVSERVDLFHPSLFNPASMVDALGALVPNAPATPEQWAGLALQSLTGTIAGQIPDLERLTGRRIEAIRVGGGGSQSAAFCQSLADSSRLTVAAGPAEATVVGNLAMQMLGSGQIETRPEMEDLLRRSAALRHYERQESSLEGATQ